MTAPLIEAKECRIAIGGAVALDRLNLVSEGSRMLFAGDTTALFAALTMVPLGLRAQRVASDADLADAELTEANVVAGSLTIEGRSVESGAHLAIVGAAALNPPLPPRWSVEEYVAWSARLGGASKGEARDLAGAALGKVGLERASKRRLQTLTLPERRAIGIAHAAVLSPRVLIVESPLAGLEGAAAAFVLAALGAATDGRRAIVSVGRVDPASPEGALARGASHVTVLAGGGVAFDGAPSDLFTGAHQYTLLVGDNANELKSELASRGIDLRGGPVRFSIALPAGTTTRDVLLAARAADAPLLELVPLVL